MNAFLLVLAITSISGDSEWSVLDSSLSETDCIAAIAASNHELARKPLILNGTTVELFCAAETDTSGKSAPAFTAEQLAAILSPSK